MAIKKLEIEVRVTPTFLEAMNEMPKGIQKKTQEFLDKFINNPNASSINYENIANATHPDMKSVRIDQTYRGIVLKPKSGNVYTMLFVAHHDDAYRWAQSRRISTSNLEGAIYENVQTEIITLTDQRLIAIKNLAIKDLFAIGIPLDYIDDIRNVQVFDELEMYQSIIGDICYAKLLYLSNGYTVKQANELISDSKENQFVIVDDSEVELSEMIKKKSNHWKLFLHPTQMELVNRDFNGPAKVTGPAGTGKTVVALHRAKRLVKSLHGNDRVLFTTFTKSLSNDIHERIGEIVPVENRQKIEILNLDLLIRKLIRDQKMGIRIDYDLSAFWSEALERVGLDNQYDVDFLSDEWSQVLVPNSIDNLRDYLSVIRVNRGKKLSRASKDDLVKVFEVYKSLMIEHSLYDVEYAKLLLSDQIQKSYPDGLYKHIIVDEAQDMSPQSFKLLRILAGKTHENDLFVVGDSRQRIYKNRATLKFCNIDVVGRSYNLDINYRTSDAISTMANNMIKNEIFDDLDGNDITTAQIQSLMTGDEPRIITEDSIQKETSIIVDHINILVSKDVDLSEICILSRRNTQVDEYFEHLSNRGIKIVKISSEDPFDNSDSVKIMTMHRVKGLEFGHIIIAGLNWDVLPLKSTLDNMETSLEKELFVSSEKSLLYVAMTRAKYSLLITSNSGLTPFLTEGDLL